MRILIPILLIIISCPVSYCQTNEQVEKIIFQPTKLPQNYSFHFPYKFKEVHIKTKDGFDLDGLLFKANSSKGVILYLHGNTESLKTWGLIAPKYTRMGYDIFMLD